MPKLKAKLSSDRGRLQNARHPKSHAIEAPRHGTRHPESHAMGLCWENGKYIECLCCEILLLSIE